MNIDQVCYTNTGAILQKFCLGFNSFHNFKLHKLIKYVNLCKPRAIELLIDH